MQNEWSDADLELHVQQWTPATEQPDVLALLRGYGGEPHHREPQRVRRVLLQSCEGSLERLRMLVAMAKTDYRDVLVRDPGPNA